MNLLELFKSFLFSQKYPASAVTVKNYSSDIKRFISWYEQLFQTAFTPQSITPQIITDYKERLTSQLDAQTIARHVSSLRKFFAFLHLQGYIEKDPLQDLRRNTNNLIPVSDYFLSEFKLFLKNQKASNLTIKNYINDIQQFFTWLRTVYEHELSGTEEKPEFLVSKLSRQVLETYKNRLFEERSLSPISINRKLSSLRSYTRFSVQKGLLTEDQFLNTTIHNPKQDEKPIDEASYRALVSERIQAEKEPQIRQTKTYSNIPPFRMLQKIATVFQLASGSFLLEPLANLMLLCQEAIWIKKGQPIFLNLPQTQACTTKSRVQSLHSFITGNYPKDFYAPLSISVDSLSWRARLLHKIKYSRPGWYKKYHKYAFAHYAHLGLLLIVSILFGMIAFDRFIPKYQPRVLGTNITASGRVLRFNGTLLDQKGSPLQGENSLRFAIYNDPVATGSTLLWQDTEKVIPDIDGNFSVSLGNDLPIDENIFNTGAKLFMGVSVGTTEEMLPRQQLPNVALSENSERVMGLLPITAEQAGSKNVLLALDSSGNLTIGNTSPTFEASNGTLSLKAQSLTLSTLPGSNGNIILAPNGQGIIDLEKPLQNISNYGSLPETAGSVEVADTFAVLATSSATSALTINQNSSGPLISASSSGIAKFTVDNTGSGTFAGNIHVNGLDLDSEQYAFNLLNSNTGIINLGGEAIAITIGSSSGTTRIRNATTALSGNLTIAGTTGTTYSGENAGISFSGNGSHTLSALSGSLLLGSQLKIGKDLSIEPDSIDGTNNLGTSDKPFDNLYINNIIASNNLTFTGVTTNINQLNGGSLTFRTSPGGDNQLNTQLTISSTGIGIGTTNPSFTLDLQDSQSASAAAQIFNTNTGVDADGLIIKLGNASTSLVSSTNHFLSFETSGIGIVGSLQGNDAKGVQLATSGIADFAEYIEKDQNAAIPWGSLVCLSENGKATSCIKERGVLLGVASEHPTVIGGVDKKDHSIPVGLTGIVNTRVSTDSGVIKPGDYITSSEAAGVGVKAVGNGHVVGKALEGFNGVGEGIIKVVLGPTWHDQNKGLVNLNQMILTKKDKTENENSSNYMVVNNIDKKVLESLGIFSEAMIAKLSSGLIKAQEITTDTAKISGLLISKFIQTNTINVSGKIISPVAEIDQLRVHIISPLSPDDKLSLVFEKSRIAFVSDTASETAVFSVDEKGNATAAGTLQAKNLQIDNDASISGTLRVKRLIADNIEGLETASSGATYITNIYQTTQNNSSTPPPSATPSADVLTNSSLQTNFSDIASASSYLASIPQLHADFATINQALMVFGPASFTDITTSGQLAVGGSLILADSSINVLGKTLELQPLRQGNVSFMGGLIAIDTDGNLTVSGNALFAKDVEVQGTLSANIIRPLPNRDLTLELPQNDQTNAHNAAFLIQNSSRSAVVKISGKGDIDASGSGNFLNLIANNLNLIRSAQADTSLTQTIASSSAGTATILKGQKERTIISPYVSKNSLIYISPTSDTMGMAPYIARQVATDPSQGIRGAFTIQIPSLAVRDISLNWWIIN